MKRLISLPVLSGFLLLPALVQAQSRPFSMQKGYPLTERHLVDEHRVFDEHPVHSLTEVAFQEEEDFPDPQKVLFRSLILPGWGQVTNRQVWKVPVIYAVFAGVVYYNYNLTRQYHGFRAAYYNESLGEESDFRFGETPDFVPESWNAQQLRETRDNLRNQRDFSYVVMFLAYGLNALDAYVFAHMRSFDVSDDLSASARLSPGILETGTPGIHLRVNLGRKGNR